MIKKLVVAWHGQYTGVLYVGKTKRRTNDSESTGSTRTASASSCAGHSSTTSGASASTRACSNSNAYSIRTIHEDRRRGHQR